MTIILDLTKHTLNEQIKDFIGELDYSCYKYNRERIPNITPEQWGNNIFPNYNALEKRYQKELAETNHT